jgi:oligopeptide transport system substrate-binding protein
MRSTQQPETVEGEILWPRGFEQWIVALLLLLLVGCGGRETPVSEGVRRGILHIGNGGEPRGLDPHMNTGITEARIIEALFEGLVARHPVENGVAVPGVAERWEISADGRIYTFYLRKEARWSNGQPLTAEDFAYGFRRALEPELGAPYASMLYLLAGAEAYHRGDRGDFSEVGVRVLGPHRLELELVEPTPYFLQALQHHVWSPVHRQTLEAVDAFADPSRGWDRPASLVGNGPFTLEHWQPGQVLVVTANPHYWDAPEVGLNAIRFYPFENENTEHRAFQSGQLHITDTVPVLERENYRAKAQAPYREDPLLATSYFLFNTTEPPLDDARVRRALGIAFGRKVFRELTQAGFPARHFTPAAMPAYDPPVRLEQQPARARTLLSEAGFSGGEGFPVLELCIASRESSRIQAEAIQSIWQEELGITIRIRNMEWKVYLDSLNNGDFDIGLLAWFGDYADPFTFLNMMAPNSGSNRTGWKHSRYAALLERSQATRDPVVRRALLEEAEALLLREMPIAPILHLTSPCLVHPAVHGWYPKLLDLHPWKYVSLRLPSGKG